MLATFTSKKLTLFLLAALALVLIPATVSNVPLFLGCGRLLLGLLTINLTLCTCRHWQRLAGSVLLIHAGILTIFIGTLWGRTGFIATLNSYEGDAISTAFRWDRQQDTPLGFTLLIKKIDRDYYPVPVRVGVIVDGKATKLYESRTGDSFTHAGGYRVEVLDLEPLGPALHLAVTNPDGVRSLQTTTKDIPVSQPGLICQLVAFQTPVIKRTWVDLEITSAAAPPVSGRTEVNRPFKWQGLRFYHTATDTDPSGRTYAGLQIVNDQGIPLVYLGFMLVCLGNFRLLFTKSAGRDQGLHSAGHDGASRL